MLLVALLACPGPTADSGTPVDTADSADSGAPVDTGDTADSGADSADSAVDTADSGNPDACTSTCDCSAGDLCYSGTCRTAGPELALWRTRLDAVVGAMHADGGYDDESAYPTEAMMTLASAAETLCDAGYAEAAQRRASFARSWENADHLLVYAGAPYIARDYVARHIYNLHAAGVALDDPALRAAADEVAHAMVDRLARQEHDGRTLFCTTYRLDPPYACDQPPWIDDNQNSEIGMAFAVLAADPESSFYEDPVAIDIADQELDAATSLQTSAGEIPIAESADYVEKYDTLYGGYAAFSWAIATAARPRDVALAAHADLAAVWLAPLSDGDPESQRYYPGPYSGPPSLSECSMRMPVLDRAGLLDPAFVDACWTILADNEETFSTFIPLRLMQDGGLRLEGWLRPAE